MKYSLVSFVVCFMVIFAGHMHVAHAQSATNTPGATNNTNTPGATYVPAQSGSSATGFDLNVRLKNPLKVNTIQDAVTLFMNLVLKIALPFVIIFFIWSGLKFILAQGNEAELKKAKQIFYGTVIGTLLILGAWTITNAIIGTVNSLGSSTTPK